MRLITEFTWPESERRAGEYLNCLAENSGLGLFASIDVFVDDCDSSLQGGGQIRFHERDCRPTIGDLIEFSNNLYSSDIVVIANADITFDKSLDFANRLAAQDRVLALSRWDRATTGSEYQLYENPASQDTWIFCAPLRVSRELDFCLGSPGCDNKLAWLLAQKGIELSNPSKTIRTFHRHESKFRNFDLVSTVPGPYLLLPPISTGETQTFLEISSFSEVCQPSVDQSQNSETKSRLDENEVVAAKKHLNVGVDFAKAAEWRKAEAEIRSAISLRPRYELAYYNLGSVLLSQQRCVEAVAAYKEAVQINPAYYDAYFALGNAECTRGRFDYAIPWLKHAVRLASEKEDAQEALANCYLHLGEFSEAIKHFEKVLDKQPDRIRSHVGLGTVYRCLGRIDEAEACYDIALLYGNDNPSSRWNRSLVLLSRGEYAEGFREFESREHTPTCDGIPRWNGEELKNRRVLVISEQGIGDTFQFVRFCGVLKTLGATVTLRCACYLHPFLSSQKCIDHVQVESDRDTDFDFFVPLLSLPHLLEITPDTIPSTDSYLHVSPALKAKWANTLTSYTSFKVGIAWQGNPYHSWDKFRSIPLAKLLSALKIEGIQYFSLQRTHGLDQLEGGGLTSDIVLLDDDLDVETGAFNDTAGIVCNLDLVITIDSALAHLCGALGCPTWVLLSVTQDWRWMQTRCDSPWYSSVRLFRQQIHGDWNHLLVELRQAMIDLASNFTREERLSQ